MNKIDEWSSLQMTAKDGGIVVGALYTGTRAAEAI
jgi:hypothetical protein